MKRVGVALAGTGFLSEKFAQCYQRNLGADLKAVYSKTEAHAAEFARRYGVKAWYTDYEKMLKRDDIDAVSVCLPNFLHASATISAAEYEKHVLCTKPLAISLDQAEKMVKACKAAGVKLMYGENWLYTPALERVLNILAEGALGKILAVEAREQHSGTHSLYATKKEYCGGGVLIHMAVHPIAAIMHLMKQPVRRVYAELGNISGIYEAEDYAVLLMRFEGDGSGIAQSNYITKGGMQDRIEIYGSEGMAFVDLTHKSPIYVYSDVGYSYVVEKASLTRGWTSPVVDENVQYGFCNMLDHFISSIINDGDPSCTGDFGKEVLKVVFAGYESAKTRMAVTLSQ